MPKYMQKTMHNMRVTIGRAILDTQLSGQAAKTSLLVQTTKTAIHEMVFSNPLAAIS